MTLLRRRVNWKVATARPNGRRVVRLSPLTSAGGAHRRCLTGARLAHVAQSGELEGVRVHAKLEPLRQPPNLRLHASGVNRNDHVAAAAQEVMMMAFVTQRIAMAAVYVHPREHAVPLEQVECAIDRGPANSFRMQLV